MNIVYCDKNILPRWMRPIAFIQYSLRSISQIYPNIPRPLVNGQFGEETAAAVRGFQQEFNLPVSGQINYATWEMILSVYHNLETMRIGQGGLNLALSPGETVLWEMDDASCQAVLSVVQAVLNNMAGDFFNLDSVTPNCKPQVNAQAIAAFQKLANLPATGVLDRNTWNIMLRFYSDNIINGTES